MQRPLLIFRRYVSSEFLPQSLSSGVSTLKKYFKKDHEYGPDARIETEHGEIRRKPNNYPIKDNTNIPTKHKQYQDYQTQSY